MTKSICMQARLIETQLGGTVFFPPLLLSLAVCTVKCERYINGKDKMLQMIVFSVHQAHKWCIIQTMCIWIVLAATLLQSVRWWGRTVCYFTSSLAFMMFFQRYHSCKKGCTLEFKKLNSAHTQLTTVFGKAVQADFYPPLHLKKQKKNTGETYW